MSTIQSIILSIVEGLTEFLPISSTGHMILVSKLMGISEGEFTKTFEIFIQLGAIFAIVILYSRRFLFNFKIYWKLLIAFIPTAVVGLVMYKIIKTYLFNPYVVSLSLVLGGIFLILFDRIKIKSVSDEIPLEDIPVKKAFWIGSIQCISMIPGVSRAAATIIGGMFNGLTKKRAAEFSFLLAIPTMFAATTYDLYHDIYKSHIHFMAPEIKLLILGFIIAFITAWIAVIIFLKLLDRYGFKQFGIYRIIIGTVFLAFMLFNHINVL
jgi:undecaprenyl-diphosphatase